MLVTHVGIGLLEAALTGAVLATVIRWRPDLIRGLAADGRIASSGAFVAGAVGIAIAIAGFVSPFASALPDGLDHAAERLGFATRSRADWAAPFAGYALPFPASPEVATAAAGILGTIAAACLAWVIGRSVRSGGRHAAHT
jgi:hypothetical protein